MLIIILADGKIHLVELHYLNLFTMCAFSGLHIGLRMPRARPVAFHFYLHSPFSSSFDCSQKNTLLEQAKPDA